MLTRCAKFIRLSMAMLGSSTGRFGRQLPIWSSKALFSLSSAVRAAPGVARNVSSQSAPCSQRAAAMASAGTEGGQAAMDATGQSLGEAAATARPFSDIPGENISLRNSQY